MADYSKYVMQPLYCSNCGKFFKDNPIKKHIVCSDDCLEDLNWKKALHVTGTEYYPKGSNHDNN